MPYRLSGNDDDDEDNDDHGANNLIVRESSAAPGDERQFFDFEIKTGSCMCGRDFSISPQLCCTELESFQD